MKSIDVTAIGELLIDFTENGISEQGNPVLEVNPGGAPCNVLSMLSRLGRKTAFVGKVGDDMFGRQLRQAISEAGIETKGLVTDTLVNTTLAFVHTKPDGDREFSFYRNPGADMMLSPEELDKSLIEGCRIFHFGSLSMTHEQCRAATKKAIDLSENAGALLSFDPNLRAPLWESLDEARRQISYGMQHCHILKISDNEIQWFTGIDDFDKGIEYLQEKYGIPMILLSMGKDGSRAYANGLRVEVPGFTVKTIETTGAGDTFYACILNYVLEHKLDIRSLNEIELREMLTFANAAAAIVTTRKGALRVMPDRKEVENLIKGV
ncbi:MAG: carbohydrate kinase [Eubacteriales bacterium]|nr:carbohydrate kinase [Eubacteriales bacterium]